MIVSHDALDDLSRITRPTHIVVGRLAQHLRPEILLRVGQVDLLGDGDPVTRGSTL